MQLIVKKILSGNEYYLYAGGGEGELRVYNPDGSLKRTDKLNKKAYKIALDKLMDSPDDREESTVNTQIEAAVDKVLEGGGEVDLSQFSDTDEVFAIVGQQTTQGTEMIHNGSISIKKLGAVIDDTFHSYFPFGAAPSPEDDGVYQLANDDGSFAIFGSNKDAVIKYNEKGEDDGWEEPSAGPYDKQDEIQRFAIQNYKNYADVDTLLDVAYKSTGANKEGANYWNARMDIGDLVGAKMFDETFIEKAISNVLEGDKSRTLVVNKSNWSGKDGTIKIYPDGTFSIYDDEYKFRIAEEPLEVADGNSYTVYSSDGNWDADTPMFTGFDMGNDEVVYQSDGDLERNAFGPDAKYVAAAELLWNII